MRSDHSMTCLYLFNCFTQFAQFAPCFFFVLYGPTQYAACAACAVAGNPWFVVPLHLLDPRSRASAGSLPGDPEARPRPTSDMAGHVGLALGVALPCTSHLHFLTSSLHVEAFWSQWLIFWSWLQVARDRVCLQGAARKGWHTMKHDENPWNFKRF